MKILIVKTSSLGDVIHAMNAVWALHREYPSSRIDWLVAPAFAEMARCCPGVNRIVLFDRKKFGSLRASIPSSLKLIRELRAERYDLVIDFQGLLRSALFAGFSGGKRIIGFARPREYFARFFYRERIAVPWGHAVDRNLSLVRPLLTDPAAVPFAPVPDPAVATRVTELLGDLRLPHVAVAPGARWNSKRFPAELFGSIMERVHKRNSLVAFVLLGGASEQDLAAKIAKYAPGCRIIDLTGKTTLTESLEVLRRCDTLLCNDSGPMHMAALLGKRVCALFGPTNPAVTGPYGTGHAIVEEKLACLHCLKRECPRGDNVACHRVDPEEVADKIDHLLNTRRSMTGIINTMENVK